MGANQGASAGESAAMSLPVVLRPEARAEFDDAFDRYEEQRPGLGVDFVTQVEAVLDRISTTPELYAQVFQDIRRAAVQRFPFAVFYKVEPQQVVVLAVFHSFRIPQKSQTLKIKGIAERHVLSLP